MSVSNFVSDFSREILGSGHLVLWDDLGLERGTFLHGWNGLMYRFHHCHGWNSRIQRFPQEWKNFHF